MDGIHTGTIYPNAKSKTSLEDGESFQDFVARQFLRLGIKIEFYKTREEQYGCGESVQGIEVKLDNWCSKSGRLSIEIAEKSRRNNLDYVPSGIYRIDNTWLYVQGNTELFFVFPKNYLRLLHATKRYHEKEEPTLRAFYLPISDALRYSILLFKKDTGLRVV